MISTRRILKFSNAFTSILFWMVSCASSLNCFAQDGYTLQPPQIAYWIHEKANVPTVIVIHGGPGATHNYLLPEWTQLGKHARLVFYDQRGNGKSQEADCYSWREHVRDLARLIDTVAPGRQVVLAGSSWGVDLALLFTDQYPKRVKGLILSGITPWKGAGNPEDPCNLYAYEEPNEKSVRALQKEIKDSLRGGTSMNFSNFDSIHEARLIAKKNIEGSQEVQFETLMSLADAPRFEDLSVNVPAIIFQGTDSCHFPDVSKQFAKKIKSARVVYIKESCHDPWIVNPQLFFTTCGEFLASRKG